MGMFDDLIPQRKSGGMFDDLVEEAAAKGVGRFAQPAIGAADPANAPPYASFSEAASGAGKALATGLLKGAVGLGTLPGNVEALARAGINSAAGLVGVSPPVSQETLNPITYNTLMDRIEARFGETYKPKTRPEKYIQTIGEFVPAAVGGGATLGARATQVLAPAVASETLGQLAEGSDYEGAARLAGAMAGGSVANLGARAITPAPVSDPIKAQYVAELEKQGVKSLTAGQKTGNSRVRQLEDASLSLPGGGRAADMQVRALEEFTEASLKKAGLSGQDVANAGLEWNRRATDEVRELGFKLLGNKYQQVAKVARVVGDGRFARNLNDAVRKYDRYTPPSQKIAGIAEDAQALIAKASQPGGMSGDEYAAYVSSFKRIQRGLYDDPEASKAVGRMIELLDGQMIKSAPANLRPQVAKYVRTLNEQFKNMLAIDKAASRQGEKANLGLLSPQALNQEIKKQSKRPGARNQRELARLARAGDQTLRDLPSSGTAERAQAISLLKSPANIMSGLAAGAVTFDPMVAIATYGLPIAAQVAAARGVTNPFVQRYMANQMVSGRLNPEAIRPRNALMAPYLLTRDDLEDAPRNALENGARR